MIQTRGKSYKTNEHTPTELSYVFISISNMHPTDTTHVYFFNTLIFHTHTHTHTHTHMCLYINVQNDITGLASFLHLNIVYSILVL
jgi:hypothetical protein